MTHKIAIGVLRALRVLVRLGRAAVGSCVALADTVRPHFGDAELVALSHLKPSLSQNSRQNSSESQEIPDGGAQVDRVE